MYREGTNANLSNNTSGRCGTNNGNEAVYAFMAPANGTYCVNTEGSAYDTYLYVRTTCASPTTEVACNDDINYNAGNTRSEDDFTATAGDVYYIFVDGYSMGGGEYTLTVSAGACN